MLHNSFMFQLVTDKRAMVCAEWGHPTQNTHCLGLSPDTFVSLVVSGWYPDCHLYGRIWPLSGPDINTCYSFLWRFITAKVSKEAKLTDEA
jgi:hypothetical protein